MGPEAAKSLHGKTGEESTVRLDDPGMWAIPTW